MESLYSVRRTLQSHPGETVKRLKIPLEIGFLARSAFFRFLAELRTFRLNTELIDLGGLFISEKILVVYDCTTEEGLEVLDLLERVMEQG